MNTSLYRTIWRWHFYAGLLVLPILAWMAVTGSLYLYKDELERWLYPDLVVVGSRAPPLAIGRMIERVEKQTGGEVAQVIRPAEADASWRMTYATGSGERRLAFVRPDTGQVLGSSREGGPLELVKELHSLTVAGPIGNVLVEVAAGWAILLVLTGFYLWWPSGGNRALTLAGRVDERRFWRNLHASAGALAGLVILFLAVTGMPWTIFWGENFHSLVASQQIGRPSGPVAPPGQQGHEEHLSWSLRGRQMPLSSGRGDVGPDGAVSAASRRGLAAPWILDLPRSPGQPYRLSALAERTDDVRLIYVDQASGSVLQDVSFKDFGPGARAFEWGIYTHQGQQYGEANRLIMLAGCLALLVLTISAPVMWWKRRRNGRLAAPPRPEDPNRTRGFLAVLLALGLLYPLTGATMLLAGAIDLLLRKRPRRTTQAV